jgi:hypothetical protein
VDAAPALISVENGFEHRTRFKRKSSTSRPTRTAPQPVAVIIDHFP